MRHCRGSVTTHMIRVFFHLNVYEENFHFFKVLRDPLSLLVGTLSILSFLLSRSVGPLVVFVATTRSHSLAYFSEHISCCRFRMATRTSISKLLDPIIQRFAPAYQAAVGKELKKYGLRIEDLYDPENDLDVEEAITRLPQDVIDARNQRLKRAMDLSVKHSALPKDIQEQQTPFSYYMKDSLAQITDENAERALLDASRPNERSIP